MTAEAIHRYITETFEGVRNVEASGNTFFMVDPEGKFPFATLVTNDDYDNYSNLNRPGIYRLNIGISKESYHAHFPAKANVDNEGKSPATSYDFTALNTLMPHPVYGRMYWVCILNPDTSTFQSLVQPLLAESYGRDVKKYSRRAAQ